MLGFFLINPNINHPDNVEWLRFFEKKNNRPLRVLHIGNIANNAYLNSKFLTESGVVSHVLCYDYYHIMGCPEWEELNSIPVFEDSNKPQWYLCDQSSFLRPEWFVQGPLDLALDYLIALNEGNTKKKNKLWKKLGVLNATKAPDANKISPLIGLWINKVINLIFFEERFVHKIYAKIFLANFHNRLSEFIYGFLLAAILLLLPIRFFIKAVCVLIRKKNDKSFDAGFIDLFKNRVERDYKLTAQSEDFYPFLSVLGKFEKLFEHYDLVQGYATDGIYPMLLGKKYVAFEHGTIRNIPFENTAQGRLCALTYQLANHVIITNADNIKAAHQLHLDNFTFIPHPINDTCDSDSNINKDLRDKLLDELEVDFLVFHPSRQHWDEQRHPDWEKGNDFLIYAISDLVKLHHKKVGGVFVNWGLKVEQSKQLIRELGIESNIKWIEPVSHQTMLHYINACDVLADQFFLGAFGSTMPKALMCGTPALIYLNEDLHKWCFPEMPPVLNVINCDEICNQLLYFLNNPTLVAELSTKSKEWYQKWHSSHAVVNKLLSVYKSVLESVA